MALETDDSSVRSGPSRPHQPTSADASLSEDGYRVYMARPSGAEAFASPHGRRTYYQTTLPREPCTSINAQRTSSSRRPVPVPDDGVLLEGLPSQPTRLRCLLCMNVYAMPPLYEEGSCSESSIITSSPDEADSQQSYCNPFKVGIGQSPWDDETPGPSYSSSEQAHAAISVALDTCDEGPSAHTMEPQSVETNGDSGDSTNNCVIVGYVKPLVERTPELVELSSDSESSADGGKSEKVKEVQPIRYHRFDAYGHRLSKKRKSDVQDSHSRERHGLKRRRKHHSQENKKRKRDRSRRKHRKNKKKSRTRDKSLSRKSQTRSPSSESVMSRDQSRSRSRSSETRKRRSKSKDSDDYLRDGYQCKKHTCYHRNRSPDVYEPRSQPSSRARTLSSESERTRSEKPGGKRKYKSHHLQSSTHRGNEDSSSAKEERALQKPLLNYRDSYKKTASFVAEQPEMEIHHKKGKKRLRSPSVEIIGEGNTTDARHHTKKRKREENTSKSHTGNSPFSSPLVITIDSDSDKDLEIQDNLEHVSSISWSPTMQQNDREREFPSPLLEARNCHYERANELDKIDMESNVTITVEDGDETPCRVPQLQESANEQVSTVRDSSSSSSSLETDNQPSSTERDLCNRFPANRSSLFARLKKLMEQTRQRDS